jgi:hypothetical protein
VSPTRPSHLASLWEKDQSLLEFEGAGDITVGADIAYASLWKTEWWSTLGAGVTVEISRG